MRLLPVLVLLLAACAPREPADVPSAPSPAPPVEGAAPPPTPPVSRIQGEWRLVEMNGRPAPTAADPNDSHHPISLTVGEFSLRARSQCVPFWRRYAWREGRLVVTPDNPGAICARGLSNWETEFDRALSAVTAAERIGDRLRLTGPGADLVFAPLPPVAPTDITGRWRLRFMHGESPPAGAPPLELTVTGDRIEANACVFAGWRYRQDGPLLELTPSQEPVCERTLTAWEQRFGRFMAGVSRATLLPNGALILDSAAEQVEFRRVE
jgi:hypothetical protein